jgi:thiamine transport system ATP-binding protein
VLELRQIAARAGDFRLSADFALPAGARAAVIGPSGSGKSTLLSVIAGFLAPDAGRVLWEGRDLTPLPPGARPVSVIFQDQNLFAHLTVAQNVGLGLKPSLRLTAEELGRVEEALARVGLTGLGARRPAELSGGQQSRVALARMLLMGRPLVLLDEPFAALGPALKDGMLDLVAELADETGATLLMVTHVPQDARRIATHAIFVEAGRVAAPVPVAAFFADPPAAFARYAGRSA